MTGAILDWVLDRTVVFSFDRSGFLRHARSFRAGDLDGDLTGRVCLVTGANSGIGRAAATALASRGAEVWLLCRDRRRGEEAVTSIRQTTGNRRVHLEVVDMVWARCGRRAVTVPTYLCLGALSVVLLPVTVLLALVIDAVPRTGHLVTLRCALALYFVCEAVGIVASFVLWVRNGLWPGATADRAVTWNLLLQRAWARTLFIGATRLFSMHAEVRGAEAVRRGPLFLFSRHASTLDHVLPPHRGGALALLDTRPDVDVAFLAYVGFEGTASLNDIWSGKLIGRTIRLCFWRVPSTEIPQTAEGRVEWLDAEWARVDAWTAYAGSRPAQAA